ncbi:MAG TPA: peptidylprolyl isomerase [Anaerolineae bacterium]|jgi:parvulin-like peptidyl-prolyl isomerase
MKLDSAVDGNIEANMVKRRTNFAMALLMVTALALSACTPDNARSMNIVGGTVTVSPEIEVTIAGTTTAIIVNTLPTQTPMPTARPTNEGLAARVNADTITLKQFDAEMKRYFAADPKAPAPNSPEGKQLAAQQKESVLTALIDRILIAQDATRNQVEVSDKEVDDELASLIALRGGQDRFNQWLDADQQSEQDLRDAIRSELVASAMRDRIVEQLPRTADYVHAYHIVVATDAAAQSVLARLKAGAKFTALAQTTSIDVSTRNDGGDLGWFTQGTGTLLWSEVEDAAFALKAGQLSAVVHSPIGYHIIKVVERQTRALTPEDTAYLQQAAIEQWINKLRTNARIEKYI